MKTLHILSLPTTPESYMSTFNIKQIICILVYKYKL